MSLNDILGSAVSGLTAAQAGIRSGTNNIANVGTPGYARQRAPLTTAVTAGRVSGVLVGEPERVADKFLEAAVYGRAGELGRSEVTAFYLDRLQALLGAPGASAGLPARLDAIAASAGQLAGTGDASHRIAKFTGDVQDALASLNQVDRDTAGLRADADSEVGRTVERANVLLRQIHDLNDEISRLEGLERSSAGPTDRRVSALEELSGLIDIEVREQPDGRVTIDAASGQVLLDRRLRQLSYPAAGASQPSYPPIDIRFADANGNPAASTGERIDSPAVGGKLGGLLELRDGQLPAFSERLGVLFAGLAEALNAASNAGTTLPPPNRLVGRPSGLVPGDRLSFTGRVVLATTQADGTLVAQATLDLGALGAGASVNDAIAAINGLPINVTAAIAPDGTFSITANNAAHGVTLAQDPASPSNRAGAGFSQYFGLNDLVRSDRGTLVPPGFVPADLHRFNFAGGEATQIVLRDASGRLLASHSLTGATVGPTFGNILTTLNASPLGGFGVFSLDGRGRIRFEPAAAASGATVSIAADSTNRSGTGRTFSSLSGLSGSASGLSSAEVRPDILATPARLPLAQLQLGAAVGTRAIGPGDTRGGTLFVDRLAGTIDLGKDGLVTLEQVSGRLLANTGARAAQARAALENATARRDDATNRRDNFSGVNIDEELAQMVVLQNSYSAAARVVTTVNEMYDSLLDMVR